MPKNKLTDKQLSTIKSNALMAIDQRHEHLDLGDALESYWVNILDTYNNLRRDGLLDAANDYYTVCVRQEAKRLDLDLTGSGYEA